MAGCYNREEEKAMANYTNAYILWILSGRNPKDKPYKYWGKEFLVLEAGIEKAFVDCKIAKGF